MYYGCPPRTLLRTFLMVVSQFSLCVASGASGGLPEVVVAASPAGAVRGSFVFFFDLSCWSCRCVLFPLMVGRHLFCVFWTRFPQLFVSAFVGGFPLHAMPLILSWSILIGVRRSE